MAQPPNFPRWLTRLLVAFHIDWSPPKRQPKFVPVVVATVLSIVGSLVADFVIVKIAEAIYPSTKTYAHFQFSDYSKLTIVGVIIACIAWPITTRISSMPRWLFLRMAVVVTAVLLLPDVWIWKNGQPIHAVGFLMVMHLAIALVTYNALVHIGHAGTGKAKKMAHARS
jgi:hypothetical protein